MIRNKSALLLFFLLVCYFVSAGWFGGVFHTQQTIDAIVSDCEKLGRFYVGDAVFHCQQIEEVQP